LAERAFETPLGDLAAFLTTAREHRQTALVAALWKALTGDPRRLAERAFEASPHLVAAFLMTAREHGQTALLAALWKALAGDPQRLAERAFETPLGDLAAFLATARQHGQTVLAAALWRALSADPQRLAERAFQTPPHLIIAFLATAREHRQTALAAALWRALTENPERLAKLAFDTPLDQLAAFLATARENGQTVLLEALWKVLAEDPQRLAGRALATPLDQSAAFLATAREHGQTALVAALWQALADAPQRLAARILEAPLDQLAALLAAAREQGQTVLVAAFWKALADDPQAMADKITAAAPNKIMPLLVQLPPELSETGAAIARCLDVGKWSYGDYRSARFSTGAPGLALTFGRLGRKDLQDALLANVLRRANPADFSEASSGLLEMSRVLGHVPEGDEHLVPGFLRAVVTRSWLTACYAATSIQGLAGALTSLSACQPPGVKQLFWHSTLNRRLSAVLADLGAMSDAALSGAVQLLGACESLGLVVRPRALDAAPLDRIGKLPVETLPHRAGSEKVEAWQRQLWLGLRVAARLANGRLVADLTAMDETLRLWTAGLAETSASPGSTQHRIDASMVRWLERCLTAGSGQLLREDEPLWRLTGFPDASGLPQVG
jgi:hypothetical protein